MATYRVALVEAWGNLHDRNRRVFENMPDSGPRERLAVMMQTLVAPQHWALERSMRLWALTDEATRASVERSDGRVLRAVRQAFDECGFEADDAALRSLVVFAAGVGLMQSAGPTPDVPAELRDRFLDFMLRP
jgi:AcrR family transcriptional regulator